MIQCRNSKVSSQEFVRHKILFNKVTCKDGESRNDGVRFSLLAKIFLSYPNPLTFFSLCIICAKIFIFSPIFTL